MQSCAVLLFLLQRCLDTSAREPGSQLLSTVYLGNKKPFFDSNNLKNTLEKHVGHSKMKKKKPNNQKTKGKKRISCGCETLM